MEEKIKNATYATFHKTIEEKSISLYLKSEPESDGKIKENKPVITHLARN